MANIKEKLEEGYIHCDIIIEILGAPKEHVVNTIKAYVEKIKKVKDMEVLKEKFAKPKKQKELFSTFVELEMLFKDASTLAFFCFDYMPSSIEIIDPEKFVYSARDFSAFFNDLQMRLHNLDMVVKNVMSENKLIKRNAMILLRNNIVINLKQKETNLKELSETTGIPGKQLEPILEKLIKQGVVKKEKKKYSLTKK